MMYRAWGLLTLAGLVLAGGPVRDEPPAAPRVPMPQPAGEFREVLPLLSAKCFACHGPDASKGGVRLDTREYALTPGRSGIVPIAPGNAGESEVLRRVCATDDAERMPPAKKFPALTATEIDLLRRWIDAGAEYPRHWAFVAPVRPPLPVVKDTGWGKNEIDAFVLHRLERAGLAPSPPADRPTLVRRLSLDLRGVPPSPAEVDAFLADESADAYEQLVDRMLSSPRYGEKMAMGWLDLARFADTGGFHKDSARQMWLYRDWVIEAFNKNMPFDRFTVEQLAGDLLPNATIPQKIASGFNRNTRFNEEGGVDPEEFVVRYRVDRVATLGQVWLGLTLGCAECHNHKADPISQKEFYQLYAFFAGIKEPMVSMNHNQPLPPLLEVPSALQAAELAKHRQGRDDLEEAIARELKHVIYRDPGVAAGPGRSQRAWEVQPTEDDKLPAAVRAALKVEPAARTEAQARTLREHYVRHVFADTRESIDPLEEELAVVRKKLSQVEAAIPHTLICEEMQATPPTHVLLRGDFQQKGERVAPATPAVLPSLSFPPNRLGLAKWLVHPAHPLTARVAVNRLWAQMFGAGLVRSAGDLGLQGDPPSHPELLDWLAVNFVESRWDVKALLKTMALSNAYRQSSAHRVGPADPENRLVYRASRHRLPAEEVRDAALEIAGLLSKKVGGPSALPYQPADYYQSRHEEWTWTPSRGEDQHRRGLYTFWRRTALHPMLAVFDAPTREETCVARTRTNTPLQALVTLNDPTFVEAARVFAERILTQGPADVDGRLTYAFRTALSRSPEPTELRVLREQVDQQIARYRADRDAASARLNVGQSPRPADLDVVEHAAWTAVASVILNLDETITRE